MVERDSEGGGGGESYLNAQFVNSPIAIRHNSQVRIREAKIVSSVCCCCCSTVKLKNNKQKKKGKEKVEEQVKGNLKDSCQRLLLARDDDAHLLNEPQFE